MSQLPTYTMLTHMPCQSVIPHLCLPCLLVCHSYEQPNPSNTHAEPTHSATQYHPPLYYHAACNTHTTYTIIESSPLATPSTPRPHHMAPSWYPRAICRPPTHTQPDFPGFLWLLAIISCTCIKTERPLRSKNTMRNKGQETQYGHLRCRR